MIETLTIAGPLAMLRAQAGPILHEETGTKTRVEPLIPPDPTAPAGPRPTFEATPLERLRDFRPVDALRPTADDRVYGTFGAERHAPVIDRTA